MRFRFRPGSGPATILAAVLLMAGCTGGGTPSLASTGAAPSPSTSAMAVSPPPTASPAPTPDATPSAGPSSADPSPTHAATPDASPAAPPVATLRGLVGGAAPGQLGSYTWGSGGSDAPWIVGKVLGKAARATRLEVALGGDPPTSWTAAWAGVSDGVAGDPSGGASGTGRVSVTTPATAGDWSLRVTATFGPGHNATYFWHLTVTG